jgi:hypothetical protein
MRASLTKWFLAEPKTRSAGFQYGFLVVILALLLAQILVLSHRSSSGRTDRFDGFIVPLMLLFNHLAYQFRWSQSVTIVLRVIAWAWIIFALPYIFFGVFTR